MLVFAQILAAEADSTTDRRPGQAILGLVLIAAVVVVPIALVHFRRKDAKIEPPADPPAGPAAGERATRVAVHWYAARALGILLGGLVLAAALGALSPAAGAVGLVIALIGLSCIGNAVRVWWFVRRHPWQAWDCRFREVPGFANGSPTLVLTRREDGKEFVLGVVSFKWRWGALNRCDRAEVWMAGDPAKGGVVAPPGGTHLLWARHPIDAGRRERLRRATIDDSKEGRPDEVAAAAAQLDQPG